MSERMMSRGSETPYASFVRSARFWEERDPQYSKQLMIFATHRNGILNKSVGKWAVIIGNHILDDTFRRRDEAYNIARIHANGEPAIVQLISQAGIKRDHIYIKERVDGPPKDTVFLSLPISQKAFMEREITILEEEELRARQMELVGQVADRLNATLGSPQVVRQPKKDGPRELILVRVDTNIMHDGKIVPFEIKKIIGDKRVKVSIGSAGDRPIT